jgi:hypothetical protein
LNINESNPSIFIYQFTAPKNRGGNEIKQQINKVKRKLSKPRNRTYKEISKRNTEDNQKEDIKEVKISPTKLDPNDK